MQLVCTDKIWCINNLWLLALHSYSLLFLTSLLFPRTFKTDMFLILPQHWVRPESFDFVFTACLISQLTVPASPKIRSQFWLFMFDSQPQGWHTPQESSHQCHAWGFVHNKSACKQAVHQTVGSCTHLVSDTCATLVADGFDNDPAWSAATWRNRFTSGSFLRVHNNAASCLNQISSRVYFLLGLAQLCLH